MLGDRINSPVKVKRRLIVKRIVTLLALLASGVCCAQPPADCKPSSLNIPGAPYPCVFPDHRAIFRVDAPDAQKVRVRVGAGFDLAKQADGLWYATTTPLVEGFHYYLLDRKSTRLNSSHLGISYAVFCLK